MSEPIKLNLQVETIDIAVNSEDNIISIPVGDERFAKNFYNFFDEAHQKADEAEAKVSGDIEIIEKLNINIDFHEFLKTKFDTVFGTGSYAKVFGEDALVGAEYVLEFINLCLPYIEKYYGKREKRFTKYSAKRVGSSL